MHRTSLAPQATTLHHASPTAHQNPRNDIPPPPERPKGGTQRVHRRITPDLTHGSSPTHTSKPASASSRLRLPSVIPKTHSSPSPPPAPGGKNALASPQLRRNHTPVVHPHPHISWLVTDIEVKIDQAGSDPGMKIFDIRERRRVEVDVITNSGSWLLYVDLEDQWRVGYK
ncbi:hypothetical protein B0H34DRAFT_802686 [Crassisporium funariophilum]|nr:hypothetical protein B0H34DRAFT_802686 [Crassisporium funariophilum]